MKKIKLSFILPIFLICAACTNNGGVIDQNLESTINQPDDQIEILIDDSLAPEEIGLNNNIFYFAYGSNMNLARMTERCGQDAFTDLGQGVLDAYDFYFYGRGYANIKPKASAQVEGVLYKINNLCLENLDQAEGYPTVYQRRVVKIKFDQKNILAQVYLVENDSTTAKPSTEYYNLVLDGAMSHDLSESYIDKIKSLAE